MKSAEFEASSIIAQRTGVPQHDIAVVLGSGWREAIPQLGTTIATIPASELPGFFASEVPGHEGSLKSIVTADGKPVLLIAARTHLYENRGVGAVVHGVRTAAACGVKTLILTNGAGGINRSFYPGQVVLISDHINLTATSPLEGGNFLDLTNLYSERLREKARQIDSSLDEGVYVQFRGPNYETPAEVEMARILGGTMVGMSTALEAIAAREVELEVLGLSLITNLAAGVASGPLSHREVLNTGKAAGETAGHLLSNILQAL